MAAAAQLGESSSLAGERADAAAVEDQLCAEIGEGIADGEIHRLRQDLSVGDQAEVQAGTSPWSAVAFLEAASGRASTSRTALPVPR